MKDMHEDAHNPGRLRRYHVKVLGNAVLEKDGNEETFLSNTINISLSGALIETGHAMPLGALLRYCFKVPGVGRTFNILAEVVRSEDSGAGGEAGSAGQEIKRQNNMRVQHHLHP